MMLVSRTNTIPGEAALWCSPARTTGHLRRRSFLWGLPGILSAQAFAQAVAFPNRPVRLIVGYPPGGTADLLARAIAEGLRADLEQTVLVENKPGVNGDLAADLVAKATPDGHMLLMTAPGPLAVNASLYESRPFNSKTAFAPVTRVAIAPLLLVVGKQVPVTNYRELLAYLKENPGKANYASQGNASSGHLAMELLKHRTGLQANHVPYKGSSAALNDLLAGHVTMMFDNTTSSLPHVRSGALRALAVAEPQRLAALPSVPTVTELGVPGFAATPWFGIATTAGTPAHVVQRLNSAIQKVVLAPAVIGRFAQAGVTIVGDSPADFSSYIATETEKWAEVVRVSGAKAD